MTDLTFRDNMTVTLIDSIGDDERVTQAARVSTLGAESIDSDESAGLIDFLIRNRHGSPFEHMAFTFYVEAPIFVWREIMRHRIASYNEESGRYKQLDPVFYIPDANRPFVQVGKPGAYSFVRGSVEQYIQMVSIHTRQAKAAYEGYESLLAAGIAREVARMSLPLNIYSSAYITMNARALMNFLSLRTKSPEHAQFKSFPQHEISLVADEMEKYFAELAPLTYSSWDKGGRVQP